MCLPGRWAPIWVYVGQRGHMVRVAAPAIIALSISSLCFTCAVVAGCSASASTVVSADTQAMVDEALEAAHIDQSDVAAVVDSQVITQDEVDAAVNVERRRLGLTSDYSYKSYLESNNMTEWDFRASVIQTVVDDVLLEKAATDYGVQVSDEEVDAAVDEVADLYPSRSSFLTAISNSGYTEDGYWSAMRRQMLTSRLREVAVPEVDPTDEQLARYARTVLNGIETRRSSFILFTQDSYGLACDVKEKLDDGADFAELASEYSTDQTASQGGDNGWDFLNPPAQEYQDALDQLEPDEVSPIVRTRFGYYIIKCTGYYQATTDSSGNIDLDSVPEDIKESVKDSLCESLKAQLFDLFVNNLEATSAIAVFDGNGVQVSAEQVGLATQTVYNPTVDDVIEEVQEEAQDSASA